MSLLLSHLHAGVGNGYHFMVSLLAFNHRAIVHMPALLESLMLNILPLTG